MVWPAATPNTNRLAALAGRTSATFGSATNTLAAGGAQAEHPAGAGLEQQRRMIRRGHRGSRAGGLGLSESAVTGKPANVAAMAISRRIFIRT